MLCGPTMGRPEGSGMRRLLRAMTCFNCVRILVLCGCSLGVYAVPAATAADAPVSEAGGEDAVPIVSAPEIVVSASRTPQSIATIPGSVTVITEAQIQQQLTVTPTRALNDLLGKLVPGFSQADQSSATSFTQTLRGREIQVLVDGVPQNTSPQTGRDLFTIDPSAVERIEVVRGATAVYGNGATGGLVNIITKKGTEGKPIFTSDVTSNVSLSHPGGSVGGTVSQGVSGTQHGIDYVFNGSFNHTGSTFDAEGDRSMPGHGGGIGSLANSNTYNLFGKLGYTAGAQRLQLSVNYFHNLQNSSYILDGAGALVCPTPTTPGCFRSKQRYLPGLRLDDQQLGENTNVNLEYTHEDFFGSRLKTQLFHMNNATRYQPFDGRAFGGPLQQGSQDSRKWGGRLWITTPISLYGNPELLWGADAIWENGGRRSRLFDGPTLDGSGGRIFAKNGIDQTSTTLQRTLAGFAQMQWHPLERWLVRAGVRHEDVRLEASDFINFVQNTIRGGAVGYSTTVFNAGTVVDVTKEINTFFNYSEGFSLPSLADSFAFEPSGTLESVKPKPIRVRNYEVGVRGTWRALQTSLSLFRSTSQFGAVFNLLDGHLLQVPEAIQGIEATVDLQPIERLRLGGTVTYQKGKADLSNNGTFTPLSSARIPPLKLTAYIEHETVPAWQWRNRIQLLYSGVRSQSYEAFLAGLGGDVQPMSSYVVLDLFSTVKAGPGFLRFGVENLLNKMYFLPQAQLLGTSITGGRGTVLSVGYNMTF